MSDAAHGVERWAEPTEDRCPSCLLADYEVLLRACSFCQTSGCDLCIHDGDFCYNPPTCCSEAAAMWHIWWRLTHEDGLRFASTACAVDETAAEARARLAVMREAAEAREQREAAERARYLAARRRRPVGV